jgi:hypothetical protein
MAAVPAASGAQRGVSSAAGAGRSSASSNPFFAPQVCRDSETPGQSRTPIELPKNSICFSNHLCFSPRSNKLDAGYVYCFCLPKIHNCCQELKLSPAHPSVMCHVFSLRDSLAFPSNHYPPPPTHSLSLAHYRRRRPLTMAARPVRPLRRIMARAHPPIPAPAPRYITVLLQSLVWVGWIE